MHEANVLVAMLLNVPLRNGGASDMGVQYHPKLDGVR